MLKHRRQRRLQFTGTRRALSTDEKGVGPDGATLRQPDERDQSADQQATPPRKAMKQAHDDVQSGQQDTDCRNRVADVLPEHAKDFAEFRRGKTRWIPLRTSRKKNSLNAPTSNFRLRLDHERTIQPFPPGSIK